MYDESKMKSLAKSIAVLECFSTDKPELGVTEIAGMLGFQKTTVFNILSTFAEFGYIVQDQKTSKYRLGLKLLHYSYIINKNLGLRDIFKPYIEKIAMACGEMCYVAIPDHGEVLYIDSMGPKGSTPDRLINGERAPLYCTGLGKAMLAFMPEEDVTTVLKKEKKRYTQYTITQTEKLKEELVRIREKGYAIDNMEHEFGICCVALPIIGANGLIVAAVSVSGPSLRFTQEITERHQKVISEIIADLQYQL